MSSSQSAFRSRTSSLTNVPTTSLRSSYQRKPTFPFEHTTRQKPRRWPLAFRFIKGSIHHNIIIPVTLHAIFSTIVVVLDRHLELAVGLPPSIIPSLSIVVGLMLVFRNQTSYNRFWDGRTYLSTIISNIRNLTRTFLTCSYSSDQTATQPPTRQRQSERADTERSVRLLLAILVATKNHLRGDWGGFSGISSRAPSPSRHGNKRKVTFSKIASSSTRLPDERAFQRNRGRLRQIQTSRASELADLVPPGLAAYEERGLGIPLQFTALVEGYIKRGYERSWWNAPQGSQLSAQLNSLTAAYGSMETIRLTPVPVAILIHQKQVLGLFGAVLPFAMVTDMGWWAIPISTMVIFTLYGIDGIASQLEDPFGYDRADIPMDALVEDIRTETLVMLDEWRRVGESEGETLGHFEHGRHGSLDGCGSGGGSEAKDGEAGGSRGPNGTAAGVASQMSSNGTLLDSFVGGMGPEEKDGENEGREVRNRGEVGGDWFIRPDGGGKMLGWGSVRFED